ncbi:hypothetical protein CVT25_003839 [Psilocybe cyanescens]|uniref:Uncharacterized protein n=1 Tax=Psilocybe cyanescens TaxID=93625 RepID=A0A409WAX3_PSICY|nr:hypothetical protein CVT25_003839 [Psilocybe cyanescens]
MVDTGNTGNTGDNNASNEDMAQVQPMGVPEQTGPPPRVPRTHKPNLIDALKSLSFTNKLI